MPGETGILEKDDQKDERHGNKTEAEGKWRKYMTIVNRQTAGRRTKEEAAIESSRGE
ncbi:hypothetical protein J31TS4_34630 [Paenibacillus sp. J31TS4]|uniref:hypothetical protein n=1 Tax=Paenibacillus sp. J31TS4 TaxID=2807195 RepID=UPI001B13A7E2|nr:hypothetical protein [Paenibacillus sp. J31TS4]GIP40183.1 hypothetical protein J31TS4_34630 [Paenibacillus sp. J31TS4]